MRDRVWFLVRTLAGLFVCFVASIAGSAAETVVRPESPAPATSPDAPPASQPTHGLKGHYYDLRAGEAWLDNDQLPVPTAPAYAVRVDPQIAFGRDKGFGKSQQQLEWWPSRQRGHGAVIWKGFIRLPNAGTYYFPTVSNNASAVYINRSRVTLNASTGGEITSDAFTITDPQLSRKADMNRSAYVVPVSVDAPRKVPLEVRFATHNLGTQGFGIDLYWITPDSKRDAAGKSVAELVPPEALFVEPTGPLEAWVTAPAVSGPHSTISSDFLYLPQDGLTLATVTVRLADQKGSGVPGKKVHLSVLSSYAPAGVIEQPKNLTDENGIATAKIKAGYATGDLQIFATDLTDVVDVGQVATLLAGPREQNSFFPPRTSPYYSSAGFTVEPKQPVVGRPSTIRFPVHNPKDKPVELTARFSAFEWNIGRRDLPDLGKIEGIVLQPGETRMVEGTWVPTEPSPHLCFTISIHGHYADSGAPLPRKAAMPPWSWDARLAVFGFLADEPLQGASIQEITQNFGEVIDVPLDAIEDVIRFGQKVVKGQINANLPDGTVPLSGPFGVNPKTGRVGVDPGKGGVYYGDKPIVEAELGATFGATSTGTASDNVVDFRATAKLTGPGGFERSIEFTSGARISDPVQTNLNPNDTRKHVGRQHAESGKDLYP